MNAPMIHIAVGVTGPEIAAVQLVLQRFSDCLADLAPHAPDFRIVDRATGDADSGSVVISSLLSEALAEPSAPWADTEARIRHGFAGVAKSGPRHYLCTVFRHVPPDAPPGLRARIRRLNLLAAELSRETGIYVIDIDRCLADVGAQAYATDFRLAGPYAADAVAREMAATFLGTGFDASFSRDVRDRLKATMTDWHPEHAATVDLSAAFRGAGAEDRTVTRFATKEAQAADFMRQALSGKVQPGVILGAAKTVIQRDGLGGFARLAWQGFRKTIASKGPQRR